MFVESKLLSPNKKLDYITTKLIDCNALKSLECGYSTIPTLARRNPIELQSYVATHSL